MTELKRISGFSVTFDKTPPVWIGYISLKSNYKSDSYHVTSSKESLREAIASILEKYSHKEVTCIHLHRSNTNDQ